MFQWKNFENMSNNYNNRNWRYRNHQLPRRRKRSTWTSNSNTTRILHRSNTLLFVAKMLVHTTKMHQQLNVRTVRWDRKQLTSCQAINVRLSQKLMERQKCFIFHILLLQTFLQHLWWNIRCPPYNTGCYHHSIKCHVKSYPSKMKILKLNREVPSPNIY